MFQLSDLFAVRALYLHIFPRNPVNISHRHEKSKPESRSIELFLQKNAVGRLDHAADLSICGNNLPFLRFSLEKQKL
jgi:hypothetical protein